jgi:hypothetical protein
VFKGLEMDTSLYHVYKNSVNDRKYKITFAIASFLFPTEFILDLPLRVDSNYIALIMNTLERKFSALVRLALQAAR